MGLFSSKTGVAIRVLGFICLLFSLPCLGQQKLYSHPGRVDDLMLDDFGNTYVFRNSDFNLVKYNAEGKILAAIRLTQPFRIQSVENPLSIFLFSENAQELKILDARLNEIQRIPFWEQFRHIKAAYVEDLQFVWLIDDSRKSLIQYQYREGKTINAFPLRLDLEGIEDFLVHDGRLYLLRKNSLEIYTFNGSLIWSGTIKDGRKLRREKNRVFVITRQSVLQYSPALQTATVFSGDNFSIVEKNSSHFLAQIEDKFYLYPLEK